MNVKELVKKEQAKKQYQPSTVLKREKKMKEVKELNKKEQAKTYLPQFRTILVGQLQERYCSKRMLLRVQQLLQQVYSTSCCRFCCCQVR